MLALRALQQGLPSDVGFPMFSPCLMSQVEDEALVIQAMQGAQAACSDQGQDHH